MRIIAGKLKGRRLLSFKASHIRPTTDRVKESVFNKIQPELIEARVLDLFSGTGNLAIESFSRGATEVVAVEVNANSLKIIRKNMEHLGVEKDIKIVKAEVLRYLRSYEGAPFDVVIADPPFTKMMSHDVMVAASESEVSTQGGMFVIESQAKERIEDEYAAYKLLDRRSFGNKKVSFFKKDE